MNEIETKNNNNILQSNWKYYTNVSPKKISDPLSIAFDIFLKEVILDIEAMVKLLKPKGILIIRTQIFDIDPLGAKCFKWKTHDIQTIGDMFNLKLIKGPFQDINKNVDNVTRWCWWWEKQ